MNRNLLAGIFALGVAGTASAGPHDVFGLFATESGNSHIEIADCGDGSPCGRVIWIDPKSVPAGKSVDTVTDANGDKVLGLTLLDGFRKKKSNWADGRIYDPEAGKTYGSRLKLLDNGQLEVKGCIGPICQTQHWPPVTAGQVGTSR